MEAAGTAPASRKSANNVSTRVVRSLFFGQHPSPDKVCSPQSFCSFPFREKTNLNGKLLLATHSTKGRRPFYG